MAKTATLTPINQFFDLTGAPLDAGYLYFGLVSQDPDQFPASMFWDAAGLVPALQPIRTIAGYPSRNGAPAVIYGPDAYSMRVKTSAGITVFYAATLGGVTAAADLAASTGAGLVGWIQAGVGAVFRWVRDKLRENVSVKDFGAVGDGTTNDTAAFLAACTSLGTKGGTVRYYDKHLIDTSFTVPANVTLKGPMSLVGSPGTNTSAPYGNMAALIVNSAATITLMGGAGHDGGLVYRKGMTFPAADSSAFAGTAFTAGGDDCFLINSQVLGFNLAYSSSGFLQRPRIYNNWLDNINGISIKVCYDIAHVHDNHAWPFATIAAAGPASSLQRSGVAYLFQDVGDWNKCTNNFSYGYQRGTQIINCNSMTLVSCSHDNTVGHVGAIGIEVIGTSTDTRIIGGQAAAQSTGIHINTNAGTNTYIEGCNTWVSVGTGLLITSGNVIVKGGGHRDVPDGIAILSAASTVRIDGVKFNNTTRPIVCSPSSENVRVGINDYGNLGLGVKPAIGLSLGSIASAAAIALEPNKDSYNVTGVTGIGSISGGFADRVVTFIFGSALTVSHSFGAEGIRLSGNANFVTQTGSTLTLLYHGTQWFEIGRSA